MKLLHRYNLKVNYIVTYTFITQHFVSPNSTTVLPHLLNEHCNMTSQIVLIISHNSNCMRGILILLYVLIKLRYSEPNN